MLLTFKWIRYVRSYDLSWAGGAPGAGYLEMIFHFDFDEVGVSSAVSMAAGGMGRRAFTASCSFALLSFARASGMAGASGRAAGCSWGVP